MTPLEGNGTFEYAEVGSVELLEDAVAEDGVEMEVETEVEGTMEEGTMEEDEVDTGVLTAAEAAEVFDEIWEMSATVVEKAGGIEGLRVEEESE